MTTLLNSYSPLEQYEITDVINIYEFRLDVNRFPNDKKKMAAAFGFCFLDVTE